MNSLTNELTGQINQIQMVIDDGIYSEETNDKLRDAIRSVVITQTYLKQVDLLLGDDIGEDDFVENLISNLKDIVYICD
jgi:hypothetical protein